MNTGLSRPTEEPFSGHRAKALWLEVVLVFLAGATVALIANQVSPRGLKLARNYFPKASQSAKLVSTIETNGQPPASQSQGLPPTVSQRLQQHGLQAIGHDQVSQRYHDSQAGRGVVFVDARDDAHYQAGHIPGAYQFNSYEMEKYFPTVLPACFAATNVIVYCNGGECEDSEFAAVTLNQAGVPLSNLFVYAGGISEWLTNGLPVEFGERNSGKLKPAKP